MILDCTLRDGGYYCDWDFDESIVKKYLTAVSKAKVDIVEIGFRFLPQKGHLGPFAYSTDEYLETLSLPSNLDIAVMVNAKEIIEAEMEVDAVLNLLFSKKSDQMKVYKYRPSRIRRQCHRLDTPPPRHDHHYCPC